MSDGHAVAWLDGRLIAPDAAAIAVDDHGFTIGDGVFETLLVRAGRATFWRRHTDRLARSLATTGMVAVDEQVIGAAVQAVIEASGLDDARVRITVTSGSGASGLRRGTRPTVLVTASPVLAAGTAGGAVHAITVPWARNERSPLAGVKSTSYAEAAAIQSRLAELGADDALLGDTQGRLSEALTSNVFLVLDGRPLTPARDCGCLGGIVREVLLEAGTAEEAHIPLDRLGEVTEAFLTSSVAGVRPIASIDGTPLPVVGGDTTRGASVAFRSAEAADLRS